MLALICLGIGLLCALFARALLTVAAFGVSFWWGLGIFLPLGPVVFRMTYPDQSHGSRMFGFATLPCFFLFIALGGFKSAPDYHFDLFRMQQAAAAKPARYAIEKRPAPQPKVAPSADPQVSLDERRLVNAKEFDHLRARNEELRMRKRDLLRSDVEGNRNYVVDLALYNQALAKATDEKTALAK
ncbi:MAG: hypothetical protein ABJB69_10540 [Spartobacteria bacterium]